MKLLDENQQRWYCYKDDEVYFAKDQRWGEYEYSPKQVDSIVPNGIARRELSSDLNCVESLEGLAGVHTGSKWKRLWTDWAKTDFWADWGISDGAPGSIYYDWTPASIFITESKIVVRTRLTATRTTTHYAFLGTQTKSGAVAVYGADFELVHESDVLLEPMGESGTKVVVIRPLRDMHGKYDSIRILTKDAARWVSAHKKSRIAGGFLTENGLLSLKSVVARLASSIPIMKVSEGSCPRCGGKLDLVAAGYYCMKCDVLLDKELRNQSSESVRSAEKGDSRYVEYLAKLEELKARDEISEETYLRLKDEYWRKFEQQTEG